MRPLGSWVPWELRDEVQLEETDEAPSFWVDNWKFVYLALPCHMY